MTRFEKPTKGRFSGQSRPLPSRGALFRQASMYNELQLCLLQEPCHDLEYIYGCEPDCLADYEENPWVGGEGGEGEDPEPEGEDPEPEGESEEPEEDPEPEEEESEEALEPEVESEEVVDDSPEVEVEFSMTDVFGGEEEIVAPPYLAASRFAPAQAAIESFSSCFVDEFPVSKREASTVSLEIEPEPVFVPPPLVTSRSRTMFDVLRATRRQALVDSVERARACPVRVVAPIVEEEVTASAPSV